jgi:hypothetical protein
VVPCPGVRSGAATDDVGCGQPYAGETMKILICYDGSADAEAAVELAGGLFQGASAVVLSVWEGFSEVLARSGVW